MTSKTKRLERNTLGRDLIVGDVHGHFSKLQQALAAINFDEDRDRLISVGDLVDRGSESHQVLDWLAKPWLHAVMGNHEQMAIQYFNNEVPASFLVSNGGGWFVDMLPHQRVEYALALQALPAAIEIATSRGVVGVVHAACPSEQWGFFTSRLGMGGQVAEAAVEAAVWSRSRINFRDDSMVHGVRAVVVGHTPVQNITSLGNTIYIDTMGWRGKEFTILDAETLQAVHTVRAET